MNGLGTGTLLAVGFAGYCFGGNLFGLRSWWAGALNFLLVAALVVRSRTLAEAAARLPMATLTVAVFLALLGWSQLFRRVSVRRRYFELANPFPGSHSLRRSAEVERHRRQHTGAGKSDWRADYLGTDRWRWVRAGLHESYGALGWRTIPKFLERFWALGAMFAIFAWADKGDLSFGESLGRVIHGALLGSPHVPLFTEPDDRHLIVVLLIAASGSVLALWSPADLKTSMAYPLSRPALAVTTYRLGLVDTGVFFLVVFSFCFAVGHIAGWLVGYEVRFDYLPYFLQPLLATCILIPLAYWARLRLRLATYRRQENTLVALVFGVLGFVIATWLVTVVLQRLFATPWIGLLVCGLLLTTSNLIYRYNLREFFLTGDLV